MPLSAAMLVRRSEAVVSGIAAAFLDEKMLFPAELMHGVTLLFR